ncbi:MAG: bifunctional diaminohydroxyphosphoribosylaminopyrimidine deaminase/5-amino-6-(5-phosphoribosylamino)uracil reductase RibD [Chloroflexi bacterium]|nr:bifunctional diaminohydroxyphosphoribosylaminopyrimidine deaminase/5-amino-6-(5-phosphoribosylamino)uracil reductase RibD [Chloroflexota bacterium]
MARALALARETVGRTSPNPAVGAVVVKDGRIVSEGRYEGPGTPHAEAVALEIAGAEARGATLYVTLEPCCHRGRTPPCAEAIVEAGVAEVRFAHLDPDTRTSGRGQSQLEQAGISAIGGEGAAEARRINEAYLKHRTTGLPFVIAKFAVSLDGKIATAGGDARWVSGEPARAWVHQLRLTVDAIAVGVNTVLADDPQLTARPTDANGESRLAERQPLRVILDSRGRTPRDAKALACGAKTLVATTDTSPEAWRREIEEAGALVAVLPTDDAGRASLPELLEQLGRSEVLTVLVEGGGILLGSFFDQRLVDKVHAVIAPVIIGGADAPTAVAGEGAARMADALRLREVTIEQLGEDVLVTGYPPGEA